MPIPIHIVIHKKADIRAKKEDLWRDTYIMRIYAYTYTVESQHPDINLYIYCEKSNISGLNSPRSTYTFL